MGNHLLKESHLTRFSMVVMFVCYITSLGA